MKKPQTHCFLMAALLFFAPLFLNAQVLFQTGQSLSISGSELNLVAVGDINNDGRQDIVAATGYYFSPQLDYHLLIYTQSTSGTFPTTQYYQYSSRSIIRGIAIADVNHDSLNDVVVGYGDSIGIFFQNLSGTLDSQVRYYSGNSVDDIKVADVNNDSLPDIVVCHWNETFIRVFYQTQGGFTSSTYSKPSGGYDEIEVGDVNSDGLNDIVYMAGQGNGGIHVFTQNSGGTMNNYVSYYPGGGSFQSLNGIAIGDLNQDGAMDIAGTWGGNSPNAYLVIWYQDTVTKLLQSPVITAAYEIPDAVDIADFNCDGKPEIFVAHGGWNSVTVWSDSANQYSTYDRYSLSVAQHPLPKAITSGDINSDGKPDIVVVGDFNNIQLMYNVSQPNSFTTTGTQVHVDTTIYRDSLTYYFSIPTIDTIPGFLIINTDSFRVDYHSLKDSIKTDSVFYRTASLCGTIYNDSISNAGYTYYQIENRDTSFLSHSVDTVQFSSILTVADLAGIKLLPNPFSDRIIVQNNSNSAVSISIYDFLGRQILQSTFGKEATINTAQFAKGIYYYTIETDTEAIKKGTIIKQ